MTQTSLSWQQRTQLFAILNKLDKTLDEIEHRLQEVKLDVSKS